MSWRSRSGTMKAPGKASVSCRRRSPLTGNPGEGSVSCRFWPHAMLAPDGVAASVRRCSSVLARWRCALEVVAVLQSRRHVPFEISRCRLLSWWFSCWVAEPSGAFGIFFLILQRLEKG